jgi:hypothetical protein
MKVYKVELMIIDHDDLGEKEIVSELQNVRYANDCIAPHVVTIAERELGEWTDDHALNSSTGWKAEFRRMFGG